MTNSDKIEFLLAATNVKLSKFSKEIQSHFSHFGQFFVNKPKKEKKLYTYKKNSFNTKIDALFESNFNHHTTKNFVLIHSIFDTA